MSRLTDLARNRVFNLSSLTPMGRIQLAMRLPSLIRLSVRLMRDSRVPVATKAGTIGVVGLVLSPLDVPGWVPVLGQMGDAIVIANVLDLFIKAAPRDVVREHIRDLGFENKFKI